MNRCESAARPDQAGFTLLELTVVLGLLSAFTLFLIQILLGGVQLFDEGEAGQTLADRASVAADGTRGALEDMIGPVREHFEAGEPDTRLLVQWVPLGLVDADPDARVQVVRASVALSPLAEDRLLARALGDEAIDTAATGSEDDVRARLDELVARAPRTGRGSMLLLAWPANPKDPDDAMLELRRGLFLPGETVPVSDNDRASLIDVMELTEPPITAELVEKFTEPIVGGLLHVEFAFWSQYTRSWQGVPGQGGPEWVWDSARVGSLAEHDDPRQRFSLDLAPESFENLSDDVYPRWVQVTLVVAEEQPRARLGEEINKAAQEFSLLDASELDLDETPMLKIGTEWVQVGTVSGNRLNGVKRAQRDTAARTHKIGAKVWAGKTLILTLRVPHGKDDWNG